MWLFLSVRIVQGFYIQPYLGASGSHGFHPLAQSPLPLVLPKQYPLERALPAFSEEVEAWEWTLPAWGSERYQEGERQSTGQAYLCLRPGGSPESRKAGPPRQSQETGKKRQVRPRHAEKAQEKRKRRRCSVEEQRWGWLGSCKPGPAGKLDPWLCKHVDGQVL